MLLAAFGLGWIYPQGIYWLDATLVVGLVALFGASLGVAIGAALRHIMPVIAVSINLSFYLFFLAGGMGVLAFEPVWLQNIAAFVPLTYGDHALQMALFYNSADLLGRDVLVLGLSSLVALVLAMIAQFEISLERTGLPYVAVVLDDSRSMTIKDSPGGKSRQRGKVGHRRRQSLRLRRRERPGAGLAREGLRGARSQPPLSENPRLRLPAGRAPLPGARAPPRHPAQLTAPHLRPAHVGRVAGDLLTPRPAGRLLLSLDRDGDQ